MFDIKERIKELLRKRSYGESDENFILVLGDEFPDTGEHELRKTLKTMGYYIDDYGLLRKTIEVKEC